MFGKGVGGCIYTKHVSQGLVAAIYFIEKNVAWHAFNLVSRLELSVLKLVAGFEKCLEKIEKIEVFY